MKSRKTIFLFLLLYFLTAVLNPVVASRAKTISKISFDKADTYTSEDLYQHVLFLQEKFPELMDLEILDYSLDNNPIYVVRIGENLKDPFINVKKKHALIESGTHAREVANPIITINIMENYIRDYYDDSFNRDVRMKDLLKESVFHFVINSNPDGYNLSKFGLAGIQTDEGKNALLALRDKDYASYKSNLNGIDINRNFPGVYFSIEETTWKDLWEVRQEASGSDSLYYDYNYVTEPSAAYYGGFKGSEVETQALMRYVKRYDFRYAVSFHSKGEVIFYDKWFVDESYNNWYKGYAEIAGKETGYRLIEEDGPTGVGFFSEYFVTETMKPCITVETMDSSTKLPFVTEVQLREAYQKCLGIPYLMMEQALYEGYGAYHVYEDGQYIRDFMDKTYATAYAERTGGVVREVSWSEYVHNGEKMYIDVDGNAFEVKESEGRVFIDAQNRTQIPVRAFAEHFEYEVVWNQETTSIEIKKDSHYFRFQIGSNIVESHSGIIEMDTEAFVEVTSGRTYVPLRFLSEGLGYDVSYRFESGGHFVSILSE